MARIMKIVLGIVGGILALAILLFGFADRIVFYFSKGGTITSAFYVEDAEAAFADRHRNMAARIADGRSLGDELSFVVTGHQLRAGSGAIIAFREGYQEGYLGTDGDYFFELTVFLHEPINGDNGVFPLGPETEASAFLTKWSRRRQYSIYPAWACLAYATSGEIGYETLDDGRLSVDISLTFENADAFAADTNTQIYSREDCASAAVPNLILERRSIASLEAWEGAPGASYDELVDWN